MCKYELDFISPGGVSWTVNFPSKQQPTQAVTVGQMKKKALKQCPYREHLDNIRLIVEGRPLDDDSASLSDYGIKTKAVVQIVRKVDGG